jgi:hypothetical protein
MLKRNLMHLSSGLPFSTLKINATDLSKMLPPIWKSNPNVHRHENLKSRMKFALTIKCGINLKCVIFAAGEDSPSL